MDSKASGATHHEHNEGATTRPDIVDTLQEKTVAVENVELSEATKDLTPWVGGHHVLQSSQY